MAGLWQLIEFLPFIFHEGMGVRWVYMYMYGKWKPNILNSAQRDLHSLVWFVVVKLHACYQLGGARQD